ncbi:zinc finger protein 804A [Heterodontus francisci]|uniref:zinc finger protein 804A n=1 Tax=Heterodontus francisci TaxID=7792 RepID=UPI00355C78BD
MACYYIVISSTHLSNGHFRNIKGVFRGPLCKNGNKTLDYPEKEKAIAKALEDLKANFYCELCDKQYYKHQEFDNHINSYDHAHKQRLKELKQREFARNVASKSRKDEKKQEKALKRLHELAELRKQVGCAPGSGPMFKSTTVAVKNASGKYQQHASLDARRADSKAADPETGMGGSMEEISRGKNKLSASNTTDIWRAEHCMLGKQTCGQKIGFSFSFPKKVPVKLESSAAVFCDNSEEGSSKMNTSHKRKIICNTYNTQTSSGTETVVDLDVKPESNKQQQENNFYTNTLSLVKEGSQDLVMKEHNNAAAENNVSSCVSQVQCKNKPKLPFLVSVPPTKQNTLHKVLSKEEKALENDMSECLDPIEDKNGVDMILSNGVLNSLMEVETSATANKLTQKGDITEELLHCLSKNCCSPHVETESAEIQNNPCVCRRPDAPFFPVVSKDESTVLQWPSEMLRFTNTEPSITFCCNPLYFDFRSSRAKACVEEIKSNANNLQASQTSLKELSRPAKKNFQRSFSEMKPDVSSFYVQGAISRDERYSTLQKSDFGKTQNICNEQVVGLKPHYNGTGQGEPMKEVASYCKPKKWKKHKKSYRHLKHKQKKKESEKESYANWKGEKERNCICKKMKRRKLSVEWKSQEKMEIDEGTSSSGTNELSDEENTTDKTECRHGQEKTRKKDSEECPEHFEVKCDQNNEASENLGKTQKKIGCDNRNRDTLQSKRNDRVCNTNNEMRERRESSEDYGEHNNFLTDSERNGCRQHKQCSLSRDSSRDCHSSCNTCSSKSKQRRTGNDYNSFSEIEYSDQQIDERHSCLNHSEKRGYESLNGKPVIIYHKRSKHRHSSSPNGDHEQSLNSSYASWNQVGNSNSDYSYNRRGESHRQKRQCQARHKLKSKMSEREKSKCFSADELQPCYPSCRENLYENSAPNAPRQDKNMINISNTSVEQAEEGCSSVFKLSTGIFAEDYHSKINNHFLDTEVSKMTHDRHEFDEHTKNRFSEMWINHKDPSEDILFPGLSFVLNDGAVLPHSEKVPTMKTLSQSDVIHQKQTDSYGDHIKDIKPSLNEVFLCHYETAPETHAERKSWLQDNSNILHCNTQQPLQNEATAIIGNQPQSTEQMCKTFSPLSQTISFAPEEIEKYRQLQIQAQQHIEQQKLVSKVKPPSPNAAVPMQQPVPHQQSVKTASITTIHHTVLQHHAATAAAVTAGSFMQPHLQSVPHAHPLPPHLTHISLTPGFYQGGHPTFLAAPQLHVIPACALHPGHFALHALPAATLFPPLFTLHTPAIPVHHLLHSNFTTQGFLHLAGHNT